LAVGAVRHASQVTAYLKEVPGGVARAASRALNSMSPTIRQEATDRITGIYNMRPKDAKKGVQFVRRASTKSLSVVWAGKGRPIPLKSYSATVLGGKTKRGKSLAGRSPVQVEVFRGKRKIVRGGFIGPNGHVFKRVGRARLPIRKLHGPALPSQFANETVTSALISVTNRVLPVRLETEMVRELRKIETGKLPPLK
jgi:hypothetical protein